MDVRLKSCVKMLASTTQISRLVYGLPLNAAVGEEPSDHGTEVGRTTAAIVNAQEVQAGVFEHGEAVACRRQDFGMDGDGVNIQSCLQSSCLQDHLVPLEG